MCLICELTLLYDLGSSLKVGCSNRLDSGRFEFANAVSYLDVGVSVASADKHAAFCLPPGRAIAHRPLGDCDERAQPQVQGECGP